MIAFYGYDGFMYSVGWLVAYLTVLLIVAEPLRNAGKYTMADVLAYRLKPRPVRAMAALSTLTVSTFYMIAQMVGAGALVSAAARQFAFSYQAAVTGVGVLMIVYVVFGGMLATTWVQIIKAILLMSGTDSSQRAGAWHTSTSASRISSMPITHVSYRRQGRAGVRRISSIRVCARPLCQVTARSISSRSGWRWSSARRVCRTSWFASTPCPTRRRRASASSGPWSSSAAFTS